MLKILLVFGTRPEAIKMAPVYHALKKRSDKFCVEVCLTAQHRQMLDMVIDFFEIEINYDLNIMKPNQTLISLSADILNGLQPVLAESRPDWMLVHGDTTTSTIAALTGFYAGIKVGHVEAGLRTFQKHAPFPEEINRTVTARLADVHFAPTAASAINLTNEGVDQQSILVTGNTVIDALHLGLQKVNEENSSIMSLLSIIEPDKRIVLITAHRRENFGEGFENLCVAIKKVALDFRDSVQVVYPVHLNPNVREPVSRILAGIDNVHLIEPLEYEAFIWLMNRAHLIITDSGGVQEEAPSLGKPVLVMRDTTERPEAVEAGTVILVGTNPEKIIKEASLLLSSEELYITMSSKHNPYGDGKSAERIADFFANFSLNQ